MLKRKIKTFNDGILKFGTLEESYGEDGNALDKKEFTQQGKLFFNYKTIREQDLFKFDTTKNKVTLKIETNVVKNIKANSVILLNGNFYGIMHIDPSNDLDSLYIYLCNFVDELTEHISIYRIIKNGPLKNDTYELYKKVWANIKNLSYRSDRESIENEKVSTNINKVATIRYLEKLDSSLYINSTKDYIIEYKSNKYNLTKSINLDDKNELIELEIGAI